VLLIARHLPPEAGGTALAAALRNADTLQTALPLLAAPGFVDWHNPALLPVYSAVQRQAALAAALARHVNHCDPDLASIGGLLAPPGWLAVAALVPEQVENCRTHAAFARSPAAAQQQCWGIDHTAIARRLARRWNLPPWLATIVGHLGLPVAIAQT